MLIVLQTPDIAFVARVSALHLQFGLGCLVGNFAMAGIITAANGLRMCLPIRVWKCRCVSEFWMCLQLRESVCASVKSLFEYKE